MICLQSAAELYGSIFVRGDPPSFGNPSSGPIGAAPVAEVDSSRGRPRGFDYFGAGGDGGVSGSRSAGGIGKQGGAPNSPFFSRQ